jgi:phosphatidylglycerol:prolipoprotein diacylglycerol transferase
MIEFPSISPEIFTISLGGFDFSLRWYAISYIAGFIVALYIMKFFVRRDHLWKYSSPPMEIDQTDDILTYLIFGVILGGRLGYVIFYNFDYYLLNPIDILRIWDGGMSFHGGFTGVVLSLIYYCSRNSIQIMPAADLLALASTPGLLFGRVANFINAELWGRPTDMPWGVVFPGEFAQSCPGILGPCARHPSQLYEAGLEGLLLFIVLGLLAYFGGLKKSGVIAGTFIAGYGLARFFVEYYRVPDPQFFSDVNPYGFAYSFGQVGVTMGQTLSIPMILIGVIFIMYGSGRKSY